MKIKTKAHFLTENKVRHMSKAKAKQLGWTIQNPAIRKGAKVIVTSGDYRGTSGVVLSRTSQGVVVEGVNVVKRHTKGSSGQPGVIREFPKPIHASNLRLVDEKEKQ
jgi:large subunit ribosomal protein L24